MENKNKINWFIGHMKKTMDILESKKKDIDFVIEIVDARLPYGSSNDELIKIFNNKQIIKVAIKSDLVDNKLPKEKNFIYCSTKSNKTKHEIVKKIEQELSTKKMKMQSKGVLNPIFVGIVVGLPNVGKSSFINFLANKKIANVENKPGVTRKVENIKIHNNIFLLDTPGVFVKNVENYEDGLNLALINCVNRNVVDKKDLASHLLDIILKNNLIAVVEKKFDLKEIKDLTSFVNQIAVKRNINIKIEENLNNIYMLLVKEVFDKGLIKVTL